MNKNTSDRTSEKIKEYAGQGKTIFIENLPIENFNSDKNQHKTLGEWSSTAICGNDITSSCLYVSSLAVIYAGVLAPIVLLLVGFTLYLFRKIYGEVGSALPLNGGTYTLLLNTTSKKVAAAAAGLTILSYIATAVISANEAIHYIRVIAPQLPTGFGVICLLLTFALLSIYGIGESAKVALVIFITHIFTLVILILFGFFFIFKDPNILYENFKYGLVGSDWVKSIFLGYAVALLGISGFESSANFIEEQKKGVFPKTLKNMWLAILFFNPIIAFLAIGMVPISQVETLGEGFLSHLGGMAIAPWFSIWISINAFLVLSGAVLTSFVGIGGLIKRMAMDRCMPDFLLSENKWRKTNHWIVLGFLFVSISIYFVTGGKTKDLAGVYTLSFLCVMAFFAIGNSLLKLKRARLPRAETAPWKYIIAGLALLSIGIAGNVYLNPTGGLIFLIYYAITLFLIFFLLLRTAILRLVLLGIYNSANMLPSKKNKLLNQALLLIKKLTSIPVLYFSKGDTLASLNEAVQYVLTNEQTKSLTVCHITDDYSKVSEQLAGYVKIIDEIYPKLKIDLVVIKGGFSPSMVDSVSNYLKVAKNRMFIGSPGGKFPHKIEDLGGVRVILSGDGV